MDLHSYPVAELIDGQARVKRNNKGLVDRVWLSDHTGAGIDLLLDAIKEHLSLLHTKCTVALPASNGRLRAALYAKKLVKTESIGDDGSFSLQLELSPADLGWLKKQDNIASLDC